MTCLAAQPSTSCGACHAATFPRQTSIRSSQARNRSRPFLTTSSTSSRLSCGSSSWQLHKPCKGHLSNSSGPISSQGWRLARPEKRRPIRRATGVTGPFCTLRTKPLRKPGEELSGQDLDNWQATVSRVAGLGFEEEEAGKLVARAFGWIMRSYWDDRVVDVVPTPEEVDKVLSYLQELGLETADLMKVVKEFPYVLACSVEKRLKVNVEQLDREWSISGAALKRSILRKPLLLGYSVDCRGDCIAECDQCWARF